MEDVKWLLRRCGLPILLLLIFVIAGVVCWGELHGYDEGSNSYEYEMIYASPYPPFGEVVDYTKNADGTITLIVDGVWPDYNSDLAFRNTVVVQPFEDGTFRYLSNSIEQIELELPPIAKAH